MPCDTQYAVYVSWVGNGKTKTRDISAFGDFSSDEDEEPENLFGEDYSHTQGHLTIDGRLFLEAVGRLPVVDVPAHGSTTDVDDFEGYDGLVYQIYLERVEKACGKTLDLSPLFAIFEAPVLPITARYED
ncbi:hypothetical protein EJ02DRAFT_437807 [Clathrospora elynae]|uniref:Uncharacterized protein n=1 Tax=Clathrospora elynae TaxID=706981 RepID=A0A6A5SD45_9PLEO|nr:hypothetical protein EJ02DRAFT_437807 [Clathrospora elynae]